MQRWMDGDKVRSGKLYWFGLQMMNWYHQIFNASPTGLTDLPREIFHYYGLKRKYKKLVTDDHKIFTYPILFQNRGKITFDAHYTYQAAWASRKIKKEAPISHIDISSDIRFVTQLSVIANVIYVEYRTFKLKIPDFSQCQGDILSLPFADNSITSLSCLHVVEHIGLGRYGDVIDSQGTIKACKELARILAPGGFLYFSLPVGLPKILFNAHRIFDPEQVPLLFPDFTLEEFSIVTSKNLYIENADPSNFRNESYACGLYLFKYYLP